MVTSLSERVRVLEAELRTRIGPGGLPAPAAGPGPLTAAASAALAVYLAGQPTGAPLSELAAFVAKLATRSSIPPVALNERIATVAAQALQAVPGASSPPPSPCCRVKQIALLVRKKGSYSKGLNGDMKWDP